MMTWWNGFYDLTLNHKSAECVRSALNVCLRTTTLKKCAWQWVSMYIPCRLHAPSKYIECSVPVWSAVLRRKYKGHVLWFFEDQDNEGIRTKHEQKWDTKIVGNFIRSPSVLWMFPAKRRRRRWEHYGGWHAAKISGEATVDGRIKDEGPSKLVPLPHQLLPSRRKWSQARLFFPWKPNPVCVTKKLQEQMLRDSPMQKTFGPIKITVVTDCLFLSGMTLAGSRSVVSNAHVQAFIFLHGAYSLKIMVGCLTSTCLRIRTKTCTRVGLLGRHCKRKGSCGHVHPCWRLCLHKWSTAFLLSPSVPDGWKSWETCTHVYDERMT